MPDRRCHPADPAAPSPAFLRNSDAFITTPFGTLRRFYDALGRGDVPSVVSLLDAQVEWTRQSGFLYYGGIWRGHRLVLDNLLKPLSGDGVGLSAKAHEFIAEGDRVVSLGTYSGKFNPC